MCLGGAPGVSGPPTWSLFLSSLLIHTPTPFVCLPVCLSLLSRAHPSFHTHPCSSTKVMIKMTKELTVTTVWRGGKQCFATARTFDTELFLESSESWRRRERWRTRGGPTQRPASSIAVSLVTGLPPGSRAVFGWGQLPFIASGSLVGSREGLLLLCLGVWAWYAQEESRSCWLFHTFVGEKGAMATFHSEAEPCLVSLALAKWLFGFYAADHM